MGLPSISIIYKSKGITAIKRSEDTIVAILVKDKKASKHSLTSISEVPEDLSKENIEFISKTFIGSVGTPKRVEVIVLGEDGNLKDGLKELETIKFNYLSVGIADTDFSEIVTWAKNIRQNSHKRFITVVPDVKADDPSIVNMTNKKIITKDKEYTAITYTSRIAGLLAGLPKTISATYQVLPEVIDVDRYTRDELDKKIDAGEFILFHDGEKVKVGRGVTSFTTFTPDRNEQFSKIKVVAILDLIYTDIVRTAEDNYIGKFNNSYDNKVLLINAINGYLKILELEGLLDVNKNYIGLDLVSQKAYLESKGIDTSLMSEKDLKEANTDDKVFLSGEIKPLDAIETIKINFGI